MPDAQRAAPTLNATMPVHRVEDVAAEQVRRGLSPFAAGLAAYYAFLAGFHLVFTPGWIPIAATTSTAIGMAALGLRFGAAPPRRATAYAWVAGLTAIVVGNVALFHIVAPEPRNFVNFALVNVVLGVAILSRPVLLALLLLNASAWLAAYSLSRVGDPLFDGAFLAGTWVLAIGISETRRRMLDSSEALRLQVEIALDRAERRLEQRDRAIRAQQRVQDGLRLLIETTNLGALIVQNGVVVYVNPALRDLLSVDRTALVGARLDALVHPDDAELADPDLLRREGAPGVELRFLDHRGESRPMDVSAAEIEHGEAPAVLLLCTDASSLDEPDRQELAQRMLAVGTLAASVAHEINNPLAYTLANLEMLQVLVPPDDTERRPLIDTALEGAGRVRDIVTGLRTFSREDEVSVTPVEVQALVQSAARMTWNEIRHRAQLVREYGPTPPVLANAARLGQVFVNLLVNAAQAIDEGDASRHRIVVRTEARGAEVVVSVTDSGRGMSTTVREQIFRPFFTTKPVGQGTGLGLSFSRTVVEELGGRIEVESAPGAGSTFRVILPAANQLVGAVVARAPSTPRVGPPRRVLVIDDEHAVGEAIAAVLSTDAVTVVGSGAEALVRLAEGSWDAVLCDVMMPELPGPEVFRQVTAAHPELTARFAFLTGGTFTESARSFLEETARPVLSKPFRARAIRDLVDQLASS